MGYPGKAIERALSKANTRRIFSSSILAPHLYREQSHTYHLITASETVRKIKPRIEEMFVSAGLQPAPAVQVPRNSTFLAWCACVFARERARWGRWEGREARHHLHNVMTPWAPLSSGICLTGGFAILY